ncbi:COG1361 S-layer family protein [Haloplanus litoreus]|uniref:COG1361 S-layer family protein n=1 Tax=Haloplanus litoreus TaxID=767515 RepID=UPI00360C34FD
MRRAGPEQYVDRVTTARGLTFSVSPGSAPVEINTGRYPAGSVPEGTAGPYPVSITVAENATPGTYRLPVRVQYTYTYFVEYGTSPPEFVDSVHDQRHYLTLRVRDVPRFELVDSASSVGVSGRGNVSVTVRNVGTDPARDATLQLGPLRGTPSRDALDRCPRVHGDLELRREPHVRVHRERHGRRDGAGVPLSGRVTYRDRDGIQRTSRELTTGVTPLPEQAFAASNVSGDLHVGEPGTIRGMVTNTGPRTVRDAVLVYRSSNPNVDPTDTEVSLGRLAPGERRTFAFDVAVSERATPTTQQLNLTVRYRDDRRTRQVSEPLEPSARIAPERDWLSVTRGETTFDIDTDNRMTVRIRNVEDVTLTDVVARLAISEPFASESRVAYVDRLAPNETATLAFGLTVSEDAVPTQSSVRMNVTADRPDGETIDAGAYEVPVTVAAESGPTDTVILVAWLGVVLALLGGGWWWLRR